AEDCFSAVSDGEHLISHDGNHTVSCRKVQSGQLCWSVDMEGGWHLLAANGKGIIATRDNWDRRSALLALDLESGHQLLRQEAAPGVRWSGVYFDGRLIFVVE